MTAALSPHSRLLARLDSLPFTRFHLVLVLALGSNWFFDGYQVQLISVTQTDLASYLAVDPEYIPFMSSVYLLGCVSGALFFGTLAFRYGRKRLFFYTLLIYLVSSVLVTLQTDYYLFSLCRFMTGVSVGGEYTAIFAAIDEMVPCAYRGRTDLIIDGSWHLGTMMASLLSLLVYQLPGSQWRALFLLGALGVLPLFCLRSVIPESPRWLLQNNQPQQAETVIAYIERKSGVTLEGEQ